MKLAWIVGCFVAPHVVGIRGKNYGFRLAGDVANGFSRRARKVTSITVKGTKAVAAGVGAGVVSLFSMHYAKSLARISQENAKQAAGIASGTIDESKLSEKQEVIRHYQEMIDKLKTPLEGSTTNELRLKRPDEYEMVDFDGRKKTAEDPAIPGLLAEQKQIVDDKQAQLSGTDKDDTSAWKRASKQLRVAKDVYALILITRDATLARIRQEARRRQNKKGKKDDPDLLGVMSSLGVKYMELTKKGKNVDPVSFAIANAGVLTAAAGLGSMMALSKTSDEECDEDDEDCEDDDDDEDEDEDPKSSKKKKTDSGSKVKEKKGAKAKVDKKGVKKTKNPEKEDEDGEGDDGAVKGSNEQPRKRKAKDEDGDVKEGPPAKKKKVTEADADDETEAGATSDADNDPDDTAGGEDGANDEDDRTGDKDNDNGGGNDGGNEDDSDNDKSDDGDDDKDAKGKAAKRKK